MARRARTPASTTPSRRPVRSLVAAAAPVDITSKAQVDRISKRTQEWQDEAWAYFDALGAIRDPLAFRANVISKVGLLAAFLPEDGDDEPIPVSAAAETPEAEDEPPLLDERIADIAADTMRRLDDVPGLMAKLSLNLDVPGECHVIGEEREVDGTTIETWRGYSDGELVTRGGKLLVKEEPKDKPRPVDPDAVVFRVWLPHARWSALATSNLQALVNEGACEELLLIAREMRAASKSRIGKGLLLVAEELSLAGSVDDGTASADIDTAEGGDEFQREIIEWITETVGGEGTAYEVAPGVWRAPSDLIANKGAVDKIDLGQPLDPKLLERAEYLLQRIREGLNIPPEISSGISSANHWGGGVIERMAFQAYMEPTVLAICQALTTGFLRPLLLAEGVDPAVVERLVVWYDPSRAVIPQSKIEVVTEGVKIGAVGPAAWRREAQLDDGDKPSEQERLERLGFDRSIMTADLSVLILRLLAGAYPELAKLPESLKAVDAPSAPAEEPTVEEEQEPTDPPPSPMVAAGSPDVGEALAAIDRRLFDRVLGAADAALDRAVERAANRIRQAANRDAAAKSVASSTAGTRIAQVLGRPEVARLAAEGDEAALPEVLFTGAFADLATRVDVLIARAQSAMVSEAIGAGSETPPDAELVTLAEAQAEDRERATNLLVASLTALALSVLFNGRVDPGEGEFDPTATVPAGLVREVLAVGGGAPHVERTRAGGLTVEGRPVGGVGTGERARALFGRVQAWWSGYRWNYGDASTRQIPFEPHRRLGGRVFARWDDPALANADTPWMGSLSYAPGDHAGCRCDWVPVVVQPAAERAA